VKRVEQERSTPERSTQERSNQAPSPQSISAKTSNITPDPQESVRRRAYQLYERRGMGTGSALDDWLQAETELREARHKSKAA
jgi:hypothetical protein